MQNVRQYISTHRLILVLALVMLGYAVGIIVRPNAQVATIAWIRDTFGVYPLAVAAVFALAGICMATRLVYLHYLALIPLIAYSVASAVFILSSPSLTVVAVAQHIGLSVLGFVIVEHERRMHEQ